MRYGGALRTHDAGGAFAAPERRPTDLTDPSTTPTGTTT